MIELVLVVCLAATPANCREERPGFGGPSMMACMMQGQVLASRWLSERPALMLSRWRCEPAGAPRKDI